MVTIDNLQELVVALSKGTIAEPLRLTVQPQYRMIGVAKCVMTLQGHPRSEIFVSSDRQCATSY